ncbi:hypothetical protein V502_08864 [Pseudogymnoascus sp. VKM F-4520 (FW-2644)]|nr:hypothetical protein V502_08864 [Pseudogymnoascus sp. VKM F-4520 (FW-2644)]
MGMARREETGEAAMFTAQIAGMGKGTWNLPRRRVYGGVVLYRRVEERRGLGRGHPQKSVGLAGLAPLLHDESNYSNELQGNGAEDTTSRENMVGNYREAIEVLRAVVQQRQSIGTTALRSRGGEEED